MSELVSIIMPSYNTARFIADSIKSVLSQTYTNWELIIVDDCSTDNTEKIIFSFNDSRIRYFKNEKNRGAAISRNKALSEARGEYIAFLDSDDLWSKDKLEKQLLFMKLNNYAFSYTNYERIDESGNPLSIICTGPKIITKKGMYRYCYPGCLTVMYKNKGMEHLQIKDIKKNNDYAIWLIVCKMHACYLLNECLAKYRVRNNSISHDKIWKKLKSHYDLFRLCDNKPPLIAFLYALRNMWFGFWKKRKYDKRCVE